MKEYEERIEAICNKYDLSVFPNVADNVFHIIESAEPSDEDKLDAWDNYHQWLYESFKLEIAE